MNQIFLVTAACAFILALCGCGDQDDKASTTPFPSPTIPSASIDGKIAALEFAGTLPKLDRSISIAGPDADKNGIRDDIDDYIARQPFSLMQIKAAQQAARTYQTAITMVLTDEHALQSAFDAQTRAVHCVLGEFPFNAADGLPEGGTLMASTRKITLNTKARIRAYLAYSSALDGFGGEVPQEDTCE